MFIRKATKNIKGKTYTNYVLVESVRTEKGPRQKTVCSLGSLKPRPKEQWLSLARSIQDALIGQMRLEGYGEEVESIVERIERKRGKRIRARRGLQEIEA